MADKDDLIKYIADTLRKEIVIDAPPQRVVSSSSFRKTRSRPKTKIGDAFGLLASTNNYINGNGEGVITAALIAQLLKDTTNWNPPVSLPNEIKRYVATLIGPTYTPLEPIRQGLAAHGYRCEDVRISDLSNSELMSKYDVLIARIVTLTNGGNASVIDGDALAGVKRMLQRKKLVVVGGCGCPYGSYPLNDLLSKLGMAWRVKETRSLPESGKPTIIYPWVVQNKGRIKEKISYVPQITDRTIIEGVKEQEAIVKSSNGLTMMAYSPYPKCINW